MKTPEETVVDLMKAPNVKYLNSYEKEGLKQSILALVNVERANTAAQLDAIEMWRGRYNELEKEWAQKLAALHRTNAAKVGMLEGRIKTLEGEINKLDGEIKEQRRQLEGVVVKKRPSTGKPPRRGR